MNWGIIVPKHLRVEHPCGFTTLPFHSLSWCSQAERPRFPSRRGFRFLPNGCRSCGTGNSRIEGPYPRRLMEKLERLSHRAD